MKKDNRLSAAHDHEKLDALRATRNDQLEPSSLSQNMWYRYTLICCRPRR